MFFCFFKQKTAYEVRISDWSSDVCSSDLASGFLVAHGKSLYVCCYEKPAPVSDFPRLTAMRSFLERALIWKYGHGWPPLAVGKAGKRILAKPKRRSDQGRSPKTTAAMNGRLWCSAEAPRSEERRVGKECVGTVRTRGARKQ